MDPASATVASIGFAASLATLAGLVIDSSKTLYTAQRRFRSARQDVRALISRLRDFESLIFELQAQLLEHQDANTTPSVTVLVERVTDQMREDIRGFSTIIKEMKVILDDSESSTRLFASRIRHVLQEDTVRQYQQQISSHIGTMSLLFIILTNRKHDSISKHLISLQDMNQKGFEEAMSSLKFIHSTQNMNVNLNQVALGRIEDRLDRMHDEIVHASHSPNCPPRILRKKEACNHVSSRISATTSFQRSMRHYSLPIGQILVSHRSIRDKSSRVLRSCRSNLKFVPPPWLSSIVIHWQFHIRQNARGFPNIGISLSPICYNQNPSLKTAITRFDVCELSRLFHEGLARPTDYVLVRRPMSLLEAFAVRVEKPNCRYEALEMYRFLLEHKAGSDDPKSAFCHSRVLISFAKQSQRKLRDSLDTFLGHGGNIFSRHSNWGSIISLIMRHGAPFDCITNYAFRQPEPWTIDELSPIDRWLIGVLAYTEESFRNALENYLSSYRSLFIKSRTPRPVDSVFSISSIVSEVRSAGTKDRLEFLKIVSKRGNRKMLEPFINTDFDLNETEAHEAAPWLRLSYVSKAVKMGNLETFETLLEAGADPSLALINLWRFSTSLPPIYYPKHREQMILELVDRSLDHSLTHGIESLLALLLRSDEIRKYCPQAADRLVSSLFQRHDSLSTNSRIILCTIMVISIILDLPKMLEHCLTQSSDININKKIGTFFHIPGVSIKGDITGKYTWLSFATHFGRGSCVRTLLRRGANAMQPDPCGRIPIEMAKDQVAGLHPRPATILKIWPYQPPHRVVPVQDDVVTLAVLHLHTSSRLNPADLRSRNCSSNDLSLVDRILYGSIEFTFFRPLEHLGRYQHRKAIVLRNRTAAFRSMTRKLMRLSFAEALFLGFSFVVSFGALLIYAILEFIMKNSGFGIAA